MTLNTEKCEVAFFLTLIMENIFERPSPPVKVLTTASERVLTLARATVRSAFGAETSTTITAAAKVMLQL